jgi:hypothetical protein
LNQFFVQALSCSLTCLQQLCLWPTIAFGAQDKYEAGKLWAGSPLLQATGAPVLLIDLVGPNLLIYGEHTVAIVKIPQQAMCKVRH